MEKILIFILQKQYFFGDPVSIEKAWVILLVSLIILDIGAITAYFAFFYEPAQLPDIWHAWQTNRLKNTDNYTSSKKTVRYCFDTDGGRNFYVKGEVVVGDLYSKKVIPDKCLSGENASLAEAVCSGTENSRHSSQVYYKCPAGCRNGACIGGKELENLIEQRVTGCVTGFSKPREQVDCLSDAYYDCLGDTEAGKFLEPLCETMMKIAWENRETISYYDKGYLITPFYNVPDCYAFNAYSKNEDDTKCNQLGGKTVKLNGRDFDWSARCTGELAGLIGETVYWASEVPQTIKECTSRVSEEEAQVICLAHALKYYEDYNQHSPEFIQLCEKLEELVWRHQNAIAGTPSQGLITHIYIVPECYAYDAVHGGKGAFACSRLSGKKVQGVDWEKKCMEEISTMSGAE